MRHDLRVWKEGLKKKNKRRLRIEKYKKYIKSFKWKKRKEAYFEKCMAICFTCSNTEDIQLHHLHYKTVGYESDSDLIPLCSSCHIEFHTLYGTKEDMRKEFKMFVKEKRNIDFK